MTILEDNLTNLNDPKHEEDPNIEDIPINENNEKSEDTWLILVEKVTLQICYHIQ